MSGLVFWEISGQSRLSILGDIRSVQAQYFGSYQVSPGSVFWKISGQGYTFKDIIRSDLVFWEIPDQKRWFFFRLDSKKKLFFPDFSNTVHNTLRTSSVRKKFFPGGHKPNFLKLAACVYR